MATRRVRMVKGPATITVQGSCRVLGSNVAGQTICVRTGRALPLEPGSGCRLRIKLGRYGRTWTEDPAIAGTTMWRRIVGKVLEIANAQKSITVMLAGDTDTGKSTFSTFLANMALTSGMKPCIIDGDVGQGDLAPPSAIGAASISKQVTDLRDIHASLFEFVGSISPAGIEYFVAAKLRSILDTCMPFGNVMIVNTDGYVRNEGVSYKMQLAKKLQPDVVVCLGDLPLFGELESGPWQVLYAKSSSQVYKSRPERIRHRLDQFARYTGDRVTEIALKQIKFVYRDRIVSPFEVQQPPIGLGPKNMEKMFVGLGSERRVEGFGLIINVTNDKLRLQTDVQAFSKIYLGNIRLDKNISTEIRPQ